MPSVPLMRARPSFSCSSIGSMPAAASATDASTSSPRASRTVALAHRRERDVGKRGKVAGAAEAAVLADDRGQAGVQQGDVGLCDDRADPGAPGGERRQSQQHGGAHHLAFDLGPAGGGVAAHERALQLGAPLERDVLARQRAEAGGDAVVRLVVARQLLDNRAGFGHRGEGIGGELDGFVIPGDGDDITGRQRPGTDRNSHGHIKLPNRAGNGWLIAQCVWDTRQ